MSELLTKTKFINALVREHVSLHKARVDGGLDTDRQYLRLEIDSHKTGASLVIRGNRIGTHWMVLDGGVPNSRAGMILLHKRAVDIAMAAAEKASKQIAGPVAIGLPGVEFFASWFENTSAACDSN